VGFFYEGLANAHLHGKYGFIDTQVRVVLAFRYDHANRFNPGKAKVQMRTKNSTSTKISMTVKVKPN
jgi:hypothetical protein